MNPESRDSGFDASHRPGMTDRQLTDPLAEYPEYAPKARRYRRDCRTDAPACPTATASPPIVQAATPWPAGSAAGQNHRRSSGRRFEACSRRSPHRTCTRKSRCALRSSSAAGPCRNIRSSAGVAVPSWSRQVGARISSQNERVRRMTKLPRSRTRQAMYSLLSFRDAPLGAGPESILPKVVMDSGLAFRAPRNDTLYRANSFSGSRELSFNRSSTIDERTCATLWCGISTLLTMSDRLFRSRNTAFNR